MAGRLAVDFGTSNTVLALWDSDSQMASTYAPSIYRCLYPQGDGTTPVVPSLIHYSADCRQWLGQQVLQRNLLKHPHTLRWAKRYIGRGGTSRGRRIGEHQVSFHQAGHDFLFALLLLAREELSLADEEIALTVPVDSFEHYAAWLGEVAASAGLSRYRLIDEASAAALGYGAHIQPGDCYLVFDFGGGTLDIAVVLIEAEGNSAGGRRCRILAKAGAEIGGISLDQLLFQDLLLQTGRSDTDPLIQTLSGALLAECEQAKIELTSQANATITLLDPDTGQLLEAAWSRSRFEELMDGADLIARIDRLIRQALNRARDRGYGEEQIKSVLLVGGSSQIPAVRTTLARIFGKERLFVDRPIDAVARGAAAFVGGADFYDHIQHSYAIRHRDAKTGQWLYCPLVDSGSPYPSSEAIAHFTVKASHDGQSQLGLAIFELGEQTRSGAIAAPTELVFDPAGGARILAVQVAEQERRNSFWMNVNSPTFLTSSQPLQAGDPCFRISFGIDGNKRLLLTAREISTGRLLYSDYPVIQLS
ncbi:Hsp70 family protein [Synechococcus sp. CS-1325]|uniref:Hsp70 family protein n=1 Tax=unclassified Synechococcus TaxID=2626047 RepID=UPI000DB349A4|nr:MULTISPECIES: Hsp70 family protein [unclassified Synechococcus]MCT0198266.1 Hsp70 family protein [Synechococcus sp. CS-1325]MCT0213657.1 Hsp70 family protein [Synechococcus sp. CS-1326]MCT0234126.1 Hsp70 family protein [Synechococcus sp. CS-1327]PZU96989.1 MAG: Hsp70 family protein [Cyanobium sp.]